MRVEREENGEQDAKVMPFVKAVTAEVKCRQQEMKPLSQKYYVAQGMQYGLILAQAILELAGESTAERLSAFLEIELDLFLN